METTIFKFVKYPQLEEIFNNHSDKINIRYYRVCVEPKNFDEAKRYRFEIKIRHNENENATELFNRVFAEVFPRKNGKKQPTKKDKIKAHVVDMLIQSHEAIIKKLETLLDAKEMAYEVETWDEENNNMILPKTIISALLEHEAKKYDAKGTSFETAVKKTKRKISYHL